MIERSKRFVRAGVMLGAALILGTARAGWASLPAGHAAAPRIVGPEAGATAYEAGLEFAWTPPAGAQRFVLVASKQPFVARDWTQAPSGNAFRVVALVRPVASFQDLDWSLVGPQDIYWAVGSSSSAGGALTFSDTRLLHVLPKFVNRVAPTPLLEVSPIGKAAPVTDAEPDRIRLEAGYTIDPAHGEPALPLAMRQLSETPAASRTFLAYYGDADPAKVREEIALSGGTVEAYIPDHTFLVRMKVAGRFTIDAPGAWVGTYQPAYKMSPRLDAQSGAERVVNVLAFDDGDFPALVSAAQAAGGRVLLTSNNGINKIMRLSIPGTALAALAQEPDVMWIEPFVPYEFHNGAAQWVVQTSANGNRRIWDMGIQGEGMVFHHSDSGIDMTHEMYIDSLVPVTDFGSYPSHRKVIAYEKGSIDPGVEFGDQVSASYHGSHTSGTVAGEDRTVPYAGFDGMAHKGKIWHSDLSGPTLGTGLAPFADLNDLFQPGYTGNAGGAARISTNSWGSAVNGAYTIDSYNVDKFMWNHPDYLIFFSNGNSGAANTVGSPATAKDCVSVGGVRNGTLEGSIYTSTSRGPTTDGRRKPTICAPASILTSSQNGPANYAGLSGTSMASPSAAGMAGLLRQYCVDGWYPTGTKIPANGFSPSAALLKAMVVNSGVNGVTSFNAPDNNIGYGRVNADSVLYFAGDKRRLLLVDNTAGLGHGQSIEYHVNVVNDSTPLEVTLCWTDFPGNPAASIQLVNNLNLTVTNGTVTYRGNIYSTGYSTTGGSADTRNVEEAVLVKSQAAGAGPGLWTIRIDGANVPQGPQPFGLCITGGVGTNAGALTLDRATYGSGSTILAEVTDSNAGGSVAVTFTSPHDPAGETVTLPGSNGNYSGSVTLSPLPGTAGDGILQVSSGDVVTATYSDASPVANVTQQATVLFNPPVITNVSAASPSVGTATVGWTTDKNANSKVYYGASPALGSSTALDPTAVFTHSASITGLAVDTDYYYDVESRDLEGNLTRDDNGGAHYRFRLSQPPPADLLLVYGGQQFERPQRYTKALGELGWIYDTWIGTQSDMPVLGNLTTGLRSYRAIWWQPELDLYPPVSDAARTAITQYFDGGGRLAICGHDIVWSNCDFSSASPSPYYTAERCSWTEGTLKAGFAADPPSWTQIFGVAGDPISDSFQAGVPFSEHRVGASGDEILPAGDATTSWMSGDGTPAPAGVRWESPGAVGVPGTAVWAGKTSRLSGMFFEWSGIDNGNDPSSTIRRNVMQKTLTWLMGRDKPNVTITAPNGGEVITANSVDITWTETTGGGTSIANRIVEYSLDGGLSWTVLATGAGPSPYSWNLSTVPNSLSALVRVRVTDNGDPTLSGLDASNTVFTLQRPDGDAVGPTVVAGSIRTGPNPIVNTSTASLTATITDLLSGGGIVAAAEWSAGPTPSAPGAGIAMSGTFASPTVAVSATIPVGAFVPNTINLWVRGRDTAGNWGSASPLSVVVNGDASVAVAASLPHAVELRQNAPNPVEISTTIVFALPSPAPVKLAIYDVGGRKVRMLANTSLDAGTHSVRWDRVDDHGRLVQPGVYYTRLDVAGKTFQRKIVTLR